MRLAARGAPLTRPRLCAVGSRRLPGLLQAIGATEAQQVIVRTGRFGAGALAQQHGLGCFAFETEYGDEESANAEVAMRRCRTRAESA